MILIRCKQCGIEFKAHKSHHRKFCSNKCSQDHKRGISIVDKVMIICKNCGKEFYVLPSRKKRIFCSYLCSAEYSKGKPHGWTPRTAFKKGHKHSEESIEKIRQKAIGRVQPKGKNSPRWKKGNRKRYLHSTGSYKYSKWRTSVFERDGYTCDECGNIGGELQAHHIRHWVEDPKLRYTIYNGITLCKKCHKYVHRTEKEIVRIMKSLKENSERKAGNKILSRNNTKL